ncbi:MAG: hypothetical protein NXI25_09445 [bacterium]|nr:hypothetical protein [bacterium]
MSDSFTKIEVLYLYRDAGNYKIYDKRVLPCSSQYTIDEMEQRLRDVLIDEEYFLPGALGISRPSFGYYDSDLDHDWLEFIGLCRTDLEADTDLDFFSFVENMRRLKREVLP